MLRIRAHVVGLACYPFGRSDFPDLRCLLKFLTANNNKVLFQLPHVPVGDRMLFKHNRRYYNVLQGGMDVAPSFPKACDVCITWNTANNILCLQEVNGKDEYLQAIRVLAPRFRFFGSFIPDHENAGGSAICIHIDLLPEEAIVTHLTTCQGRDHFVNIQSGRHNFVIVNVHFEPELTLTQLRGRLRLIHPHWPAYPSGVGIILGEFNICDPEEGRFDVWNQSFTDGDPGKTAVFHSFFPYVLEVAQSDYTRRDSTALGVIRTLSRIDRIFINLPMAEARDFHCYSHVVENLGKKTIPSDHAAVRLVIQKPIN